MKPMVIGGMCVAIIFFNGAHAQESIGSSQRLDFEYQVSNFPGVGENIPIHRVYDYGLQTYIQVPENWRPNPYNQNIGRAIGAYTCHNNTLYEVPLLTRGPNYIADGTFQSLFLYQKSTKDLATDAMPAPLHHNNENPRGLLAGVTRLDYVGSKFLKLREGKDDCMKLLRNVFQGMSNNQIVPLTVAIASNNMHEIIHSEINAAAFAAVGKSNFIGNAQVAGTVEPPVTGHVIQKWQVFRIPFYVNNSNLGPTGRQRFQEILPIAKNASEIIVRAAGDNANIIGQWLEKDAAREPKSNGLLIDLRAQEIISALIASGVSSKIITSIPQTDPGTSGITNAADTIIEIASTTYGSHVRQNNGVQAGLFAGNRFNNPQQPPTNIQPIIFVNPDGTTADTSPPETPTPTTDNNEEIVAPDDNESETPLLQLIEGAAELNTFRASKGQTMSSALSNYVAKNGRQLVWQVGNGVDFQFESDFTVSGPHFVETLRRALEAFPLQAIMDSQGSPTVVIVRKNAATGSPHNTIGIQEINQ